MRLTDSQAYFLVRWADMRDRLRTITRQLTAQVDAVEDEEYLTVSSGFANQRRAVDKSARGSKRRPIA
jgi:hypothetical protein